jgi:nicotinamide-nucleotide amidase
MPDSNRKQALLPDTSLVLPNRVGTAPGFSLEIEGCRLYFLPGVPGEMKRMFSESVLPDIKARLGDEVLPMRIKVLSTFGVTESGAAQKLGGFEDHFPNIKLGYRFSFPEIHIRLYQEPGQGTDLDAQLRRASDWVRERLGEAVFSEEGKAFAEVVGDLLRSRGRTLALAESCTGGYLAHLITSVSGSSDYFLLSTVTYANAAKRSLLGVQAEAARTNPSEPCASAWPLRIGSRAG